MTLVCAKLPQKLFYYKNIFFQAKRSRPADSDDGSYYTEEDSDLSTGEQLDQLDKLESILERKKAKKIEHKSKSKSDMSDFIDDEDPEETKAESEPEPEDEPEDKLSLIHI